jgi:hypothetical protein
MSLYLDELQFKFEFRSCRMIFGWRVIAQINVIRPEPNSNLNCNLSRYSVIPNIKSIYQRTSKKSLDTWYLVFGYIWMSYSWSSNFVPVEWFLAEFWLLNLYFLFNCNSSRYSFMPNMKSIYQRTSKKSQMNIKVTTQIKVAFLLFLFECLQQLGRFRVIIPKTRQIFRSRTISITSINYTEMKEK